MEEPFPEWVETLLPLFIFGPVALVVLAFRLTSGSSSAFTRAMAHADDFILEHDRFDEVSYRSTRGRPTTVRERSFERPTGKANATHTVREWEVEVFGLSGLGERTTLFIGLEGLTGAMRNRDRFKDIRIGDLAFDKRFKVGGSDPDVVRGVFANEEVKAAVTAVFDEMTVLRCVLEGDSLLVEFLPNQIRTSRALRRLALIRRLGDALGAASGSLALPHPAEARGSAAAQSGSPVGVRIV